MKIKEEFMKIDNIKDLLNFIHKHSDTKLDKEMIKHFNDIHLKNSSIPKEKNVHYDIRKKRE